MLELATATGDKRYREAADAALAYERAVYDPAARNWPDLRNAATSAGGQAMFATFWCHGAPGGALARLRSAGARRRGRPARRGMRGAAHH